MVEKWAVSHGIRLLFPLDDIPRGDILLGLLPDVLLHCFPKELELKQQDCHALYAYLHTESDGISVQKPFLDQQKRMGNSEMLFTQPYKDSSKNLDKFMDFAENCVDHFRPF